MKSSHFRIGMLVLVFLMLMNSGLTAQDLTASLFTQGMQLYNQKDFNGAADYLGQVVDMNSGHAQARLYLVYSLMALKNYPGAARHLEVLYRADPGNAQYKGLKTQLDQYSGVPKLPPKPTPKPEPILTTRPLTISLPRSSGFSLPSLPRRPQTPKPAAVTGSETVHKDLSPLEKAVEELDAQHFASAAEMLDSLIAKEKSDPQLFRFRGLADLQMEKFESARKFFDQALKAKPGFYDAQYLIGDSFFKEGRYPEAEEALQKALKIKDDPYGQMSLAETKRLLGKLDDAIALYEKVIKSDEKLNDARVFLAQALLEKGETDKASETINQVLAKEPDNAMARFVRGKILVKGELYDDGISSIKHAINLAPDMGMFKIFLAQTYFKLNRINEALDLAGKLVTTFPNNWEVRMVLVQGLFQSGDLENAEVHLDKAEEINKNTETLLTRCRIARRKGDNARAFQLFQLYLSQDQNHPDMYLDYAQLLDEMGESSSAADIYNEVKRRFPDSEFANTAEMKLGALTMKIGGPKTAEPAAQGRPAGKRIKVEY